MNENKAKIIAHEIAKAEKIIESSSDKKEVKAAEKKILKYSLEIQSLEDMMQVDALVQEIFSKNLT